MSLQCFDGVADLMVRATNLKFNMSKTLIMPITVLSQSSLCQQSLAVRIVESAKYLGVMIGPSSPGLQDAVALERAHSRVSIVKQLGVGIPLGVTLSNITIISVLRYALVHASASPAHHDFWRRLGQSLQAGPYAWLGPLLEHANTLRWP